MGQGEAATLLTPKAKMFEMLSKELNPRCRSLLGLKLKNDVPIEVQFFRFEKSGLLTSDIQGLNHDLARAEKGYFVMLYAAIRHAIECKMRWSTWDPRPRNLNWIPVVLLSRQEEDITHVAFFFVLH